MTKISLLEFKEGGFGLLIENTTECEQAIEYFLNGGLALHFNPYAKMPYVLYVEKIRQKYINMVSTTSNLINGMRSWKVIKIKQLATNKRV